MQCSGLFELVWPGIVFPGINNTSRGKGDIFATCHLIRVKVVAKRRTI